ncbi:DUF2029 domain-containing protein [Actinomadura montaniterrae]|uniref:DUF2029 domain-containing protein n=1 Tax=Actinomadura montaniterrae TaxID=1803903 RepID=A0A6L3VRH8_9ACTN|nr:DUF2029 domain-containing protein [Actinomadura montaniterrae]
MTRPGPARPGTIGLWAIGASLCCFLATALLGPSAFQPAMDARFGEPPYSLDAHPSPYLVLALVVAGVAAGTAGLALCFLAVRRGWRVRAFPLVAAGLLAAVAFMFMPPVGSTDHLNYASYGRMAATGHDPYETRAVDLPKDPVAGAPEEWRSTPSVYGPIATGEQAVASWIGGGSVRLTVFVLSVFNVLAFAATALILYRTSRDEDRRLRTALLWTCNPLLLFHLISGAHNDVLAIAPMVAALTVFDTYATGGRWRMWGRALAAGVLTGVGGAIKMPAALAGGGPAWALLREGWKGRRWRALGGLAALAGGAAATAATAYALAGPHALDQVREASNMVSFATPWHLLDRMLGRGSQRDVIKTGSLILGIVLFLLLARGLPKDDPLAEHPGQVANRRMATAIVMAWLLAAPYVLPWYDGFGWALLALLPLSRIDWILLAHTAALSLAYLPARAPQRIGMPHDLSWLFTVVRPTVIPWTLLAVLAALAVQCLRPGRSPASAPRPRASAGSPG